MAALPVSPGPSDKDGEGSTEEELFPSWYYDKGFDAQSFAQEVQNVHDCSSLGTFDQETCEDMAARYHFTRGEVEQGIYVIVTGRTYKYLPARGCNLFVVNSSSSSDDDVNFQVKMHNEMRRKDRAEKEAAKKKKAAKPKGSEKSEDVERRPGSKI